MDSQSLLQVRHRFRITAASVTLFSTLMVSPLWAIDDETPCERLSTHEVAFVGVAQKPTRHWVTPAPDVAPRQRDVQPVTVERAFRGVVTSVVYLTVAPALEEGRSYLVYANRLAAPPDVVVPMFLKAVGDAEADLQFLDTAISTASGATIYGVLLTGNPDDTSQPRRPLPGVRMRVLSKGGQLASIVTGQDGSFSISGVPDGVVWFEPLLPDRLIVQSSGVDARAGGCTRLYLIATFNGRVRGRVSRHDGKAFEWLVDLVPVDPRRAKLSTQRITTRVDKQGNFEFSARPPGEYFVGVNLLRPPSAGMRYRPTYYPGTTDRTAAIPIVIGEGTVHDGIDLTLTEETLRGELEVRVDNNDGPGEIVVCFQEISNEFGKPGGTYPQFVPDTPIIISVLDGLRYRLAAHVESIGGQAIRSPRPSK